jgi:hypothetical protein
MFTKGQTVYYGSQSAASAIRARIETAHRDGTYTITALFTVRPDGRTGNYLGYKYKHISAGLLRAVL